MRRHISGVFAVVLAVGGLAPTDSVAAEEPPNIVLINLDDADVDLFDPAIVNANYPHLARLRDEGTSFTNFHVTTPLCGPQRASLWRGQYAHNTGVQLNYDNSAGGPGAPTGGFDTFYESGFVADQLGGWLRTAGYSTRRCGPGTRSIPNGPTVSSSTTTSPPTRTSSRMPTIP